MSVLIKGMKMPIGEDEGILLAIYDGKAYHIGTKQEHDAIEVPEPHGELVDVNDVIEECVEEGQCTTRYKVGEIWELNMHEIINALSRVKTVIPASEVET